MRWYDPLLKSRGIKIDHEKGESYVKNQPTSIDGYNFPSKLHAAVYEQLKLMELAGEIRDIRCEVTLPIVGKLKLKVDFVVFNVNRECDEAHEAKGYEDKRFKAIVQAWHGAGPMDLIIWKGSYRRPSIWKTVRGNR
jgi:hypothetical protein